jgi:hypothetical protein
MTTVLSAILAVFTEVGNWIPNAVQAMIPIFWTASENGGGTLTFMGVLAVAGLAFSVVFLDEKKPELSKFRCVNRAA